MQDGDELLTLAAHDAGHVLLKFFLALRANQALPSLHGEHDLDVDLSISISHITDRFTEPDVKRKLRQERHVYSRVAIERRQAP
jgi:hypothetical protein